MGKISKEDGFKVPEGYLEGLTDRILDRLKDESPDLPQKDGFEVPEGYFESLNKKVLGQVKGDDTKVIRLQPYRKWFFTAASVAAVVLIFFGLQWQAPQDVSWNDIASLELEEYVEDQAEAMSSYEIAEVLTIEDLEVDDFIDESWEEENIVEYLDDTIDDIDELNLNDDE